MPVSFPAAMPPAAPLPIIMTSCTSGERWICISPRYNCLLDSNLDLLTPLKRHWGYEGFRPLQERIVRSLLDGHDIAVIMPTGGGKSLCYQLPALILERTAIVISPLIALMQDQAAQLDHMGIPAAVLNSSMTNDQQSLVMRNARDGE